MKKKLTIKKLSVFYYFKFSFVENKVQSDHLKIKVENNSFNNY